jgi:hypothetical protein
MIYPDRLVMMDAVDGKPVADVRVGAALRRRFPPKANVTRSNRVGCAIKSIT